MSSVVGGGSLALLRVDDYRCNIWPAGERSIGNEPKVRRLCNGMNLVSAGAFRVAQAWVYLGSRGVGVRAMI